MWRVVKVERPASRYALRIHFSEIVGKDAGSALPCFGPFSEIVGVIHLQ